MENYEEYFGDPDRIEALRRASALWTLLRSTGRYRYYGRAVGLNGPSDATAEEMEALASIQGVGTCHYFPKEDAKALFDELNELGLLTDRHELFRGDERSYSLALEFVEQYALPEDLELVRIDGTTPAGFLQATAHICANEGVAPVTGKIMRGVSVPGVVLVAADRRGQPVACASSHQMMPEGFEDSSDVFWGGLATIPSRRGEGIGVCLGAKAIIHMWETHRARGFITGVRSDNLASQRLCAKLGVTDSKWIVAHGINPTVLGSNHHTK